jgi:Fur family zinc uptake transcriptional regulator
VVDAAAEVGFAVEGQTVEIVGICSGCKAA